MEIVLDHDQKPQGVFLPLDEWEQLKHGINRASDLYKLMDELSQKDIFDMNADEFSAYLAPVAQSVVQAAHDQDLYFSYPSGMAPASLRKSGPCMIFLSPWEFFVSPGNYHQPKVF